MKQEHTKTPLTIRDGAEDGELHLCIPGYTIATIDTLPPEMAEIYARDLAMRYNLHDKLVDALRGICNSTWVSCYNDMTAVDDKPLLAAAALLDETDKPKKGKQRWKTD